jgi:asparagine synthase (glutamine-hydrolysing)
LRRIAGHALRPWISRSRRQALLWPHLSLPSAIPAWVRPEWARRIGLNDRDWPVYWPDGLPGLAQRQRSRCFSFARAYINNENVLAYAATQQVELRHPFHDRRLTEFLLNVPGGLLLHGREKKYLLRQAMRGTLPELVRTRQTKAPFDSHIVEALSRVISEQTVSSLVPVQLGWLDGPKVWELFARFQSSGGTEGLTSVLWFAVSVDTWCRHAAGA